MHICISSDVSVSWKINLKKKVSWFLGCVSSDVLMGSSCFLNSGRQSHFSLVHAVLQSANETTGFVILKLFDERFKPPLFGSWLDFGKKVMPWQARILKLIYGIEVFVYLLVNSMHCSWVLRAIVHEIGLRPEFCMILHDPRRSHMNAYFSQKENGASMHILIWKFT